MFAYKSWHVGWNRYIYIYKLYISCIRYIPTGQTSWSSDVWTQALDRGYQAARLVGWFIEEWFETNFFLIRFICYQFNMGLNFPQKQSMARNTQKDIFMTTTFFAKLLALIILLLFKVMIRKKGENRFPTLDTMKNSFFNWAMKENLVV